MALSVQQFGCLFDTLLQQNCAWVAVLALLQLCVGERGACMCSARFGWLCGLDSDSPQIQIPPVNKKTKERDVPLEIGVAKLLHSWIHAAPLADQWPLPGQPRDDGAAMFPGFKPGGRNVRRWRVPVCRQTYHRKLVEVAAPAIKEQVLAAKARGQSHVFSHASLSKLGTHTMKRSGVSMLKDHVKSTALVSKLTGTSASTLDSTYDEPTDERLLRAVRDTFAPISSMLRSDGPTDGPDLGGDVAFACRQHHAAASMRGQNPNLIAAMSSPKPECFFCGNCGQRALKPSHSFCTRCGEKY